jgi:hypothetical protein
MVEVIQDSTRAPAPLIHIYFQERGVAGSGIASKTYGDVLIASREQLFAREVKLNTLWGLQLTPHLANFVHGYEPMKWINQPGMYDNYATIQVFDDAGAEQTAGIGPCNGSVWLDFIAIGE